MPDERHHRGAHPEDPRLFSAEMVPLLRSAVADLSWLLSREYAMNGALKLVGDRYNLSARQRVAIMRCACSDAAMQYRSTHQVPTEHIASRSLLIDGYNVLTTIEAALSNAFIFIARDHCVRDIASIHGTYRKVEETIPALDLAAHSLQELNVSGVTWYLDAPVSNSGRLKTIILELAALHRYPWQVQIVPNPDAILSQSMEIIATADSVILDRCQRWFNLAREILMKHLPNSRVIDLS